MKRTRLVSLLVALCALPAGGQLGPVGGQLWHQGSPGLTLAQQQQAWFGRALAAGDFDCDGYDDLAIAMPGDDLGGDADVGLVLVLYGSDTGLDASGHQLWTQDNPTILGTGEPDDYFGWTLAAGDFDGDGCADLAVGVPFEDVGAQVDAGLVAVIYGSDTGLTGDGDQVFAQGGALTGNAEPGDHVGMSLAAGDVDDDGYDDLAIGVPDEDGGPGNLSNLGGVHLVFGGPAGLGSTELFFQPGTLPVNNVPAANDHFGAAVAIGDLLGGGARELAIGMPGRAVNGGSNAGQVVLISDPAGAPGALFFSQDSANVPGIAEAGDLFGSSLAVGNFDGDAFDELAVGVPGEDVEGVASNAGAVNVMKLFPGALHQIWTQEDLAPEQAETTDQFGARLTVGDFDADGRSDLVVGVPSESLGPLNDAGLIHVLYGEAGGLLTAAGAEIWIQTFNPSETSDQFGYALAAGRFSGHSGTDLAVGVPFETLGGTSQTGAVNVIASIALFLDGFESGDTSAWSGP